MDSVHCGEATGGFCALCWGHLKPIPQASRFLTALLYLQILRDPYTPFRLELPAFTNMFLPLQLGLDRAQLGQEAWAAEP